MFIYIYNSGTAYSLEFPCPQDFRWEVMESDKKYREVALYAKLYQRACGSCLHVSDGN